MSNLSQEEIKSIQEYYYSDPVAFLQEVLPHWFSAPLSWVHLVWLAIMLNLTDFLSYFWDVDKFFMEFV